MSIQKAQNDDYKLYVENMQLSRDAVKPTKIPPPPILLSRSDTTMTLRPSPYQPADGSEVRTENGAVNVLIHQI